MTSCLVFESTVPVGAAELEGILAAASELCAVQPWVYCEPILPAVIEDGRLRGWTRLNLVPWPEDVETAAAAEQHDLAALLEAVSEWSRDYGIDWIVRLDENAVGEIHGGICDPGVQETFDALIALTLDEFAAPGHRGKSRLKQQLRLFDPDAN